MEPLVNLVDRLRAIEPGTMARLVYRQLRADDYAHDKFQIEVIAVDERANVLRFVSKSGRLGPADAMPLGDIEDVWIPDDAPWIRVSGYMDFRQLEPYRYVSRPKAARDSKRELPEIRMTSKVSPQVAELNANARRLLSFLHDCHIAANGRTFSVVPCADTFNAAKLDENTYQGAARRLIDRGLAKPFSLGGSIVITAAGVHHAEDAGLLDDRLPIDVDSGPDLASTHGEHRMTIAERTGKKVFIVHGHDEDAKQAVETFLHRLQLEPVILHLKANSGRTIIEKLEEEAEPARYAVILLTPDDEGRKRGTTDLTPRARQNVTFEHGYFVALLKRKNVCALYKPGVEQPSDLSGVLYVEMDDGGAWKGRLAKELHAAGVPFDAERALGN